MIMVPIYYSHNEAEPNTHPRNRYRMLNSKPSNQTSHDSIVHSTESIQRTGQLAGKEQARQELLTGVTHGGADGVAAGEEQLDDPGRDVPRRAGDAHHLPHPGRHHGAHLRPWMPSLSPPLSVAAARLKSGMCGCRVGCRGVVGDAFIEERI